MPIKSSPAPLAISEIVTEFGDDAGGSDSLSEYYRGGANVNDVSSNNNIPTSGAIDIGDFYGTGNAVSAAASAGTNIDVAPLFASPATFTNAVSKILTIAAPIQIVGNNIALTVPANMAGTLDIQNAGNIIGSRGNGGNAGSAAGAGGDGGAGGAAISVLSNGVSLNNSGTVSGGGGGGGGGAGGATNSTSNTVNFGAANYGNTRQWKQNFAGITFQNNTALYGTPIGTINWTGGSQNTTQLNTNSSGTNGHPARINRGNPLNDPQPTTPHSKRFNIGGGFYTQTTTTPGGAGGAGGNGQGYDQSQSNGAAGGSTSPGSQSHPVCYNFFPGGYNASTAGSSGGNGGTYGNAGSQGGGSGSAGGSAGKYVQLSGVSYTLSNSGTLQGNAP